MIDKVVSCFIALTLVTLVQGEILAAEYEYIPDVGYYAFGMGKNWTYAQTDCMSTKGRLAVINSEEERQAIVSFLRTRTPDTHVFGGYTNNLESQYVTTEGKSIKYSGYTKWEEGKPSGAADRCGGINTQTGELTDLDCTQALSYVCEKQLWTNYTYVEGLGYYKLHTEGKAWADAYDVCKSEGAHLLVIDSQAEADAAMKIFKEHPDLPNTDYDYYAFLGFRAVFEELSKNPNDGTYLTIFDTSVSDLGFVKWYNNGPQIYSGAYCGSLLRDDGTYIMISCGGKLAFFCEKNLQAFNRN